MLGYLPGFATPRMVCDVPFVGKRWVHMLTSYDRERASRTGRRTTAPASSSTTPRRSTREYHYYDPIYTLPERARQWWRAKIASGLDDLLAELERSSRASTVDASDEPAPSSRRIADHAPITGDGSRRIDDPTTADEAAEPGGSGDALGRRRAGAGARVRRRSSAVDAAARSDGRRPSRSHDPSSRTTTLHRTAVRSATSRSRPRRPTGSARDLEVSVAVDRRRHGTALRRLRAGAGSSRRGSATRVVADQPVEVAVVARSRRAGTVGSCRTRSTRNGALPSGTTSGSANRSVQTAEVPSSTIRPRAEIRSGAVAGARAAIPGHGRDVAARDRTAASSSGDSRRTSGRERPRLTSCNRSQLVQSGTGRSAAPG